MRSRQPVAGDRDFVVGQLVAAGLRVVGADQGSLLLAEPDGKALRFALVADRNGASVPSAATASLVGRTVPIGEGVTGMAALTHDVQASSGDAGVIPFHRVRGDGAPHAVLAAPILSDERLLGVLTAVSFDRRKGFSTDDVRAYGVFANLAASILAAVPASPTAEEEALVSEALAFVRARPGRAAALRSLLAVLSRFA